MPRNVRPGTLVLGEVTGAAELVGAIIDRIADGALADGDRLPSTRALAQQTGLSRGTVVRAFDELAAAGFVSSRQGSGTRVSTGAGLAARAGARTRGAGEATLTTGGARSAGGAAPGPVTGRRGRRCRRRPFPNPVGAVRRATYVPGSRTPRWWTTGRGGRRCGRPPRRGSRG